MFLAKNKVSSYFLTCMCYYGYLMIVPYYYSYLLSIISICNVFRVCTYGNNVVFIFHVFSLISLLLVLLCQVVSDSVAS
jgi:hypothetical protein